MRKKLLSLVMAGLMACAALPMTAGAAKAEIGVVIKDKVYIRTEATVNSPDQGILEEGMRVYVNGTEGEWTKITFGTIEGYIRSDLLQLTDGSVTAQVLPESREVEKDTETLLRHGDSGEKVSVLQVALKEAGYFFGPVTGSFGSLTRTAVEDFQEQNGLSVDGVAGRNTLTLLYKGKLPEGVTKAEAAAETAPAAGDVLLADWFTVVADAFPRNAYATVTDVETGISFRVKRQGGYNHADIEPATAEDTAKCKQIYGGTWSWARRAAILTLDDGTRFAASINGMPHGADTVPGNNMNGQICIHFLNSRTHCSDKVCPQHQAMVQKAYAAYNG